MVAVNTVEGVARAGPQASARRATLARVWRNPAGALGLVVTSALVVMAVLAPVLAPNDPVRQVPGQELTPPSPRYVFGTDELGRDILSRIIFGSRVSLTVGLLAVTLGSLVGIGSGLAAGYLGGWVDHSIMRLYDSLLAFPAILLGIGVATVLGPGAINAAVAVAMVSVPQFARLARACVLGEKEREYILAARSVGAGDARILVLHILPNSLAPLLVQLSLALAYAVLLEASLSFLGLGAQPPEPSWGSMLNTSRVYLRQAPWYGVFPGIALSLLLLGLNFLADGVRDALDPRRVGPG